MSALPPESAPFYDDQQSLSMNHYEELGIPPDATEEEIRRAHRRLTKLLHPDQQTDETLRRLAETQMRRLNGIVELLTNDERRRVYDQQVKPRPNTYANRSHVQKRAPLPLRPRSLEIHRAWHTLPWWVFTIVGALVLTSAAVWYYADYLGSSFNERGAYYTRPAVAGSNSGKDSTLSNALDEFTAHLRKAFEKTPEFQQLEVDREAASSHPDNSGPESATKPGTQTDLDENDAAVLTADSKPDGDAAASLDDQASSAERVTPPSKRPKRAARIHFPDSEQSEAPSTSDEQIAFAPPPTIAASPASSETLAKVLPVAVQPPAIPLSANGSDQLEGEWIYAPSKPERKRAGLYPPDFIRLDFFRSEGHLRGRYQARYLVSNRRDISPDVSFSIAQAEERDAHHFIWHSDDGSEGTLKVKRVGTAAIRIEWQTTLRTERNALVSGVATLVRR
jgi:curved DNA-binding protein CbpA